NGFPRVAYALEDERHATRSGLGLTISGLRLRPETGDKRAVAPQHSHAQIAHVQFNVMNVRIRTCAIGAHGLPSARDRAVVVKKYQLRRVPVSVRHRVDITMTNAFEQRVECYEHAARRWVASARIALVV